MLMDMPEVKLLLTELRKEYDATDPNALYPAYLDCFNSVTDWKFSSGDYFAPIPYESERMGFSPSALLKKKYKSVDEARMVGKYCAGFAGDKHVITVLPGQRTVKALDATLYDELGLVLHLRTVSFKWLGTPEKMQPRLRSVGRVVSRTHSSKLEVGVGIGGAFSILLVQYSNEGHPIEAIATNKNYPGEAKWEYRYTTDGRLEEIFTEGAIPLWKRKDS